MDIQKGDQVLVNLAPFIGAILRCDESVPCEVLEVDGLQVLVRTQFPCREVSLWILASWVEGMRYPSEEFASSDML